MKRMTLVVVVGMFLAGCSGSGTGSSSSSSGATSGASSGGGSGTSGSGGSTGGDPAAAFLGTWTYGAQDADAGVNTVVLTCPDGDGGSTTQLMPRAGSYTITRVDGGTLSAAVTDGCTWTYAVSNGQAVMSPTPQTCVTGGYTVLLEQNVLTRVDASDLHETASGQINGACTFSTPDARLTGP